MSEPYLAEIVLFAGNFAPAGWAFCDGQILSIAQNTALFSLLGTTFGGNGQTTFALPDLRGRAPIGPRQGPGLSNYDLGQVGGSESITLTTAQMPSHGHPIGATNGASTSTRPANNVCATGGGYSSTSDNNMQLTGPAGGSQPHSNIQPFLGMNYIIAIQGIYPSRN